MAKNKISFGEIGSDVETRLGFQPDATQFNGLSMATIESIELKSTEVRKVNEDGTPNTNEFAGKTVPSIVITFKQVNLDPKDDSARYITLVEKITNTKKTTGEDMSIDTWFSLVEAQFKRLQHITNAFDKGGLLPKSKSCPAVDLEFTDAVDARILKMTKIYKHFMEQLVGKDEAAPKYKDVKFWLVVVASYTNGYFYEIPSFIDKGIIEVVKKGVKPVIAISNKQSLTLSIKPKKGAAAEAKADMSYNDTDASTPSNAGGKTPEQILADLLGQ